VLTISAVIKAKPETLMQCSPWGLGIPGVAHRVLGMSTSTSYPFRYSLVVAWTYKQRTTPNEIAQSEACNHTDPVKYWVHTNHAYRERYACLKRLATVPAQRAFHRRSPLLDKGYSTHMTVRFLMGRPTTEHALDFSNEALQAPREGIKG